MYRLRLFTWSTRTRIIVWLASATFIAVGPIAQAAYVLRRAPTVATFDFPEVQPAKSIGDTPAGAAGAANRAADYLAERNPIVDRLLPEGEGGTRFFEHLAGAWLALPRRRPHRHARATSSRNRAGSDRSTVTDCVAPG